VRRAESLLGRVFGRGKLNGARTLPVQPMRVRSYCQLAAIRATHGSAFGAALDGAINAEEYLKLEKCDDC